VPAAGVVLYVYHTNPQGIYPKKGNETGWGKRHGYLRGWLKTNSRGEYKFLTSRPGSYPQSSNPAHIHIFVKEAGKILADYTSAQRRIIEVTKEKVEAELNFLKSQINPHFVFNSLNSIYFLIDKENVAARTALHKFSALLRFQLYELNSDQVPIEKEMAYLNNYIELQRLRQADNCLIQFNYSPSVQGFAIQPLLLIPFVENAFKHLSHFDNGKSNTINIRVDKSDGQLCFSVVNTTEPAAANKHPQQGGIGLANVQHRLALLYPQKHKLTISEKDDLFQIELLLMV
jgi:LytS/YehU family sensor histidine kinase